MDLVEIALEALLGDEEICPGVVLAQSTPHRLSFQIIYNYGDRSRQVHAKSSKKRIWERKGPRQDRRRRLHLQETIRKDNKDEIIRDKRAHKRGAVPNEAQNEAVQGPPRSRTRPAFSSRAPSPRSTAPRRR